MNMNTWWRSCIVLENNEHNVVIYIGLCLSFIWLLCALQYCCLNSLSLEQNLSPSFLHSLPSSHNSHTFHPSSSSLIILQKTTLVLLPPLLSRSLHLNHPSAQKHETETQENTHTNPPFTSSPLQHHTIPLPKNTKQNPLSLTSPSIISFTPQTNPSHTVTNKPEPHSSAKHSSLIFPNQPCLIIAHRWTKK